MIPYDPAAGRQVEQQPNTERSQRQLNAGLRPLMNDYRRDTVQAAEQRAERGWQMLQVGMG